MSIDTHRVEWSGTPVKMPGIYHGIPIEVYHSAGVCAGPSISASGLKKIFHQSPKHYFSTSPYNPAHLPEEPGDSLTLGRAAHHLMFGEANFKEKFAVRPESLGGEKWNGNRTACKLWLKQRADEGVSVITAAQAEAIKGMASELLREPLIRRGLLDGYIEHSFIWFDQKTKIWMKSRPDATPNDSLDFSDLKTVSRISWRDLQRSIKEYGYYMQAGMAALGVKAITGRDINSFSLVFVESSPPHCVEIVTLKDTDIERGMLACTAAVKQFSECLKTGEWVGPRGPRREDAAYIEMTEWDQKSIDEHIKELS